MSDFISLLAESGLVVIGESNSSRKPSFVRDVYNAHKAGDTVLVLSHDASEEIVSLAVETAESADNVVVLQCHDTKRKGRNTGSHYSARDLELAIDRRNGMNTSAPGDTWGNVTIGSYLTDTTGNTVGFMVQ